MYCINPLMTGVYSIAEVVDDSNKRPDRTIFIYWEEDGGQVFNKHQLLSLNAVEDLLKRNGARVLSSMDKLTSLKF